MVMLLRMVLPVLMMLLEFQYETLGTWTQTEGVPGCHEGLFRMEEPSKCHRPINEHVTQNTNAQTGT